MSDVFPFPNESMSGFPRNSVNVVTSDRGDSIDKSQHPDLGFPEGRLHQTERAGVAEMSNMFTSMSMLL